MVGAGCRLPKGELCKTCSRRAAAALAWACGVSSCPGTAPEGAGALLQRAIFLVQKRGIIRYTEVSGPMCSYKDKHLIHAVMHATALSM